MNNIIPLFGKSKPGQLRFFFAFRRRTIIILGCIISITALIPAQQLDETPLAKVGSITITRKEFLTRYEMTPGINRSLTKLESNKAEFLLSMIAEKLLVHRAKEMGWDNDTVLRNAVQEVERLLVRDELYRKEVQRKISISEQERKVGLQRSLNDMKVYFLYAKTKEGAEFLAQQIRRGKPLERFSFTIESADEFEGPDSAVARWGDVDERMEEIIYRLKLNETSAPVQLDDGWYIVKLMGKTVTVLTGEKERKGQLEKVESVLRRRKEQRRMSEYMNSELKAIKTDVRAQLLKRTIVQLWDIAQKKNPVRTDSVMFFFDRSVVDSLRLRMGDTLRHDFVKFPHTVWSLEKTMEKISGTNLTVLNPSLKKIRIDMEQRLRDIIDQEYLVVTGYREGLHQSAAVRQDLAVWRDTYMAQIVKNKIEDTLTVTQGEIEELRRIFHQDTSIVYNNDVARSRMMQMKANHAFDRYIGAAANETEITFFEKNFKETHVSSTTSMVFRYLGFGGRMFAVPFVVPQTGWINYWQKKTIKLP